MTRPTVTASDGAMLTLTHDADGPTWPTRLGIAESDTARRMSYRQIVRLTDDVVWRSGDRLAAWLASVDSDLPY